MGYEMWDVRKGKSLPHISHLTSHIVSRQDVHIFGRSRRFVGKGAKNSRKDLEAGLVGLLLHSRIH
jgi:hypothetical protein